MRQSWMVVMRCSIVVGRISQWLWPLIVWGAWLTLAPLEMNKFDRAFIVLLTGFGWRAAMIAVRQTFEEELANQSAKRASQ